MAARIACWFCASLRTEHYIETGPRSRHEEKCDTRREVVKAHHGCDTRFWDLVRAQHKPRDPDRNHCFHCGSDTVEHYIEGGPITRHRDECSFYRELVNVCHDCAMKFRELLAREANGLSKSDGHGETFALID